MNLKKRFVRAGSLLLSMLLCLFLIQPASATFSSRPSTGGFTASYCPDDEAKEGITFRLYQIATYANSTQFTLNRIFSAYNLTLPSMNDSIAVNAFTNTLAAYIERDKLRADATQTTDRRGSLSFRNLDLGMYLVIGETYKENEGPYYIPVPFLVFFPYMREVRGGQEVSYQADNLEIKYEKSYGGLEDFHVIKAWRNESPGSTRPATISVDLIQDGEIFDTIILSSDNNWRHTWRNLGSDHRWQLVETVVPQGYTTSVTRDGNAYTVTNTIVSGRPPVTDPEDPGTTILDTPPALTEMPDLPGDIDYVKPDPIVDIPDSKIPLGDIPQTGQLWWPVPLFLIAGVVCVACGTVTMHKRKEHR